MRNWIDMPKSHPKTAGLLAMLLIALVLPGSPAAAQDYSEFCERVRSGFYEVGTWNNIGGLVLPGETVSVTVTGLEDAEFLALRAYSLDISGFPFEVAYVTAAPGEPLSITVPDDAPPTLTFQWSSLGTLADPVATEWTCENGSAGPGDDADGDGVPDSLDQCPGADDTIDVDADTIPDCIDPLIDSDGDGVADADDVCDGTDRPEEAAPNRPNRYRVNVEGEFVDKRGDSAGVTIDDTHGCTAAQIIEAMDLGLGHEKFGITAGELDNWIAAFG